MNLPGIGQWSLSGLLQSLPSPWAAVGEETAACTSVLLKLPSLPVLAARELKVTDSAELSTLRDEARKQAPDSDIDEQIRR